LTGAVSLSAFLTALIGSVCFSLWLPGADALVTLQKAFVATLFMSSLAALPFAFGWARTRRERVLTSAVGWIAILAALSGLAWMFFSAPLGAFLVALFLVPLA